MATPDGSEILERVAAALDRLERERDEARATLASWAATHPTGRCSCAGEGSCQWCAMTEAKIERDEARAEVARLTDQLVPLRLDIDEAMRADDALDRAGVPRFGPDGVAAELAPKVNWLAAELRSARSLVRDLVAHYREQGRCLACGLAFNAEMSAEALCRGCASVDTDAYRAALGPSKRPVVEETPGMPVAEFVDFGYLQEVNRYFLHPLGLALTVEQDDHGATRLHSIQDFRAAPEGMIFADGVMDADKAARVWAERGIRAGIRQTGLGYVVQPAPGEPIEVPDLGWPSVTRAQVAENLERSIRELDDPPPPKPEEPKR